MKGTRPCLDAVSRRVGALWAPPIEQRISEWAEQHRTLPKGTTPRPGPWRCDPFQVEILDALCDPAVSEVVCLKSTQVGWSEMLLTIIAYFIAADPQPMMLVLPTMEDAKGFSQKRVAPMVEHTPAVKGLVHKATSRKPGNTLTLKKFPGGFLKITGANSGTGLRSDPIGRLFRDEADAYPEDVDGEGDPLEISRRRTDQYPDAKILTGGTPAKPKGFSPVEKAYKKSSRGQFHVPCPDCGHLQPLLWRDPGSGAYRLVYTKDADGQVQRVSVGFACAGCGVVIPEREKYRMIAAGRWVHADPGNKVRGYYLNALYSLAKDNWADLAQEWVDAQDDPLALKAFINLRLGETWEEQGQQVEPGSLAARLEPLERGMVPAAAGVLTCYVDVQGDRLEAQVKAWGAGEESWLVDWRAFHGDPHAPEPWGELDAWLLEGFRHQASGKVLQPDITLVDSRFASDAVYDFVHPRQNAGRRVFAAAGVERITQPGLAKEGGRRKGKGRVRLFDLATDVAKKRVAARLQIQAPGPGYVHLPDWVTEEYLEQLVSEKLVTHQDRKTRRVKRTWTKTRSRNEALDLEVGCLCGLFILQAYLAPSRYRDLQARAADHEASSAGPAPNPRPTMVNRPQRMGVARAFSSGLPWRPGGGSW